ITTSCPNLPTTRCGLHAGTASAGPIRCPSTVARHFQPSGGGMPNAPPNPGTVSERHPDAIARLDLTATVGHFGGSPPPVAAKQAGPTAGLFLAHCLVDGHSDWRTVLDPTRRPPRRTTAGRETFWGRSVRYCTHDVDPREYGSRSP